MRIVLDTNIVLSALLWQGTPHHLLADYLEAIEWVEPIDVPRVVAGDVDDDRVIAAAVAARVDLIVSGDRRHLLPIGNHESDRHRRWLLKLCGAWLSECAAPARAFKRHWLGTHNATLCPMRQKPLVSGVELLEQAWTSGFCLLGSFRTRATIRGGDNSPSSMSARNTEQLLYNLQSPL